MPITNYGLTIAYSLGIFERALGPFPAALEALGAAQRLIALDHATLVGWLRETDPIALERLWNRADAVRPRTSATRCTCAA